MPIKVIISFLCLSLTILANAQNMSVTHFGVDTKNDLSARTKTVKDANGIPCALVKVLSLDEITKIEGNVVEKIDKGVEVWVYLSPGTKFLKVHTLHHLSLDINFLDYISNGLKSNTVYQLELKSDLPPEVLFGSSDASRPVEKASKDSPLLPEWWKVQEYGRYVGVSNSSYDGEIAKQSALLNAIQSFALKNGMNVNYVAMLDIENDKEDCQQTYVAQMQGFSVRLLQEYYNYKGEYFVLCAIENDENTANRLHINWNYKDESKIGSLTSQVACEFTVRRQPIKCFSEYSCEWVSNKVRYTEVVSGVKLFESEYSISDFHNNFLDRKIQPLGFEQKQFLSSLPLIPDSLSTYSAFTSYKLDETEHTNLNAMIRGRGISQSREVLFCSRNAESSSFIREIFPSELAIESVEVSEREIELSGLDTKYLELESQIPNNLIIGKGKSESPLFEISKNNAFISAVLDANDIYGKTIILSGTSNGTESFGTYNPIESTQTSLRVYPLWYLDVNLRKKPNKKVNKEWESTLKNTDNGVSILIPMNK